MEENQPLLRLGESPSIAMDAARCKAFNHPSRNALL